MRTALQLPPFGLTTWLLADRLVADFEPSHRSANSAETADSSLVIEEFEATNSRQIRLGRVCGYCGHKDIRVTQAYIKLLRDTRKSASHDMPL